MSLLPQNVLQAAEADLMRRIRNKGQARQAMSRPREKFEHYAFHREHVRRAKSIQQLVCAALMQPQPGLRSKKRNTRMLYGDAGLLVKALRLLEEYYGDETAAATKEFA